MPEMYRKLLAKPGLWQTGQGPIYITPARTKRWAAEHEKMRLLGLGVPVVMGHALDAVPEILDGDPPEVLVEKAAAADRAYALGTTGHSERLEWDARTGDLYVHAEVPPGYHLNRANGSLENPLTSNRLKEVSPGIGDWTDGYGTTHRDVLLHTALCTHPVLPGQTGFEPSPLSTPSPAPPGAVRLLSAGGRARLRYSLASPKGPFMAADDDDTKPKKDGPPKGDAPPADDGNPFAGKEGKDAPDTGLEGLLDEPEGGGLEPDPAGTAITDPGAGPAPDAPLDPAAAVDQSITGGGMTPAQIQGIKEAFQKLGQPLPADTTPANIADRIMVLLNAAAMAGGSLVPQPGGADQGLDLSTAGSQPDPNGPAGGAGLGGMTFMSTRTQKRLNFDPAGRKLAETEAGKEVAAIAAAWDAIAATGNEEIRRLCQKEKAFLGQFHMSVNPDNGAVYSRAARARLRDFKLVLRATGAADFKRLLSSNVKPERNPARAAAQAAAPPSPDAARAEMARLMGVPVEMVPASV